MRHNGYPTGVIMDPVLEEDRIVIFDKLSLTDERVVTVVGFSPWDRGEIEVMDKSGQKFFITYADIAKRT